MTLWNHAGSGTAMTYRANIPRIYLFVALGQLHLWLPVWIVFFERRGLSLGQIGMLEFMTIILLSLAEVPTGTVADIWGRKVSMALGTALHGLALLGLLTEVLSPIFFLAYALWGVSFSFLSGATEAFAYDSLKADGVAHEFSHVASRYAMIRQGAAGIAGLAGGFVAAYSLTLCFILTAIACFAASAVILTGREPPADHEVGAVRAGYLATLGSGVRIVLGRPLVRYVILIGATVQLFTILLTMTVFQPYAGEVGVPLWSFGAILLAIQTCSMVGSYLSPRISAALGRERVVVIALMAMSGFQVMLWIGASRPAVAFFAAAVAVGAIAVPVLSAMLNDAIPSRQRATIISLQSLAATLGLGIVQFGVLSIGERTSMALALGLAGLLMAALATPLVAMMFRTPVDAAELPLADIPDG
jgi:MFS family permease